MGAARSARTIAAVLVGLCLCGCPSRTATPAMDPIANPGAIAAESARHHGQADAVRLNALVRTRAADGDAITFTVRLWSPADGRVRLLVSKLDNDLLSLLVRPDGAYVAWGKRAGMVARGDRAELAAARAPVFLTDLGLLVADAKHGPVPPAATWAAGSMPGSIRCALGDDGAAELLVEADGRVREKRVFAATGEERLRLTYADYGRFDRVQRPRTVMLRLPAGDGGISATAAPDATVTVSAMETAPVFSERAMTVTPPAGTASVDLATLINHLGD